MNFCKNISIVTVFLGRGGEVGHYELIPVLVNPSSPQISDVTEIFY